MAPCAIRPVYARADFYSDGSLQSGAIGDSELFLIQGRLRYASIAGQQRFDRAGRLLEAFVEDTDEAARTYRFQDGSTRTLKSPHLIAFDDQGLVRQVICEGEQDCKD